MQSDHQDEGFAKLRAPGHILVDEDYVDAVRSVVTSPGFGLPGVYTDTPDKAGLVALCWNDDTRDPRTVVDRIRALAPELEDMVSPDHTVGLLHTITGDDAGASVEMGGPAVPAAPTEPTDVLFPRREDTDVAGRGVVVGVVDSGIVGHPWLDGSFLATPGSIDPLDEDTNGQLDRQAGHGVFVTGLILREAPAAIVRVVRAFDQDGFVRIRRAAQAIVELDELGADVINLSFGGYTKRNRPPLAHRKALSKIRDTTVVVAAAGNHDPDDEEHQLGRKFWPGAIERVVAVAALDTTSSSGLRMAPFSNLGPWVDVAAPGTDVVSTYVTFPGLSGAPGFDGWARWSGTSFAAPVVTGRIAAAMTDASGVRVRSAQKAKEQVIEEAAQARPAGLAIAPDVVERIILPPEPRAADLVDVRH